MAAQFHRVGLVGRSRQEGLQELLDELLDLLGDRVGEVMLEDRLGAVATRDCPLLTREEIGERADLVIVLGGDGSLLSAARTMARFETPVLGINRGRLGFLTDISPDEVSELVPAVLEGRYEREERFLLDVNVEREGKVVARADALNDVVLNSGTSAQMIEFELSIDGEFVYRQRADGLIISTPTGSTAYSLSGGGPIMHPSLDAIVLVPMFPHTLSSRPIVVKGDSLIRLDVLERNRIHPPVTCDGQVNMTARPGDAVLLRKKPHRLTLLHPLGHSFYASCRDKLRWSNALVN
jgi:NAD+ kinase